MNIISNEWYTIPETTAKLEIAEKTLRKWALKGRLGYRLQSVPGKRPQRLYNAADVERLKLAGPPKLVVAQHPPDVPRNVPLIPKVKSLDHQNGRALDTVSMAGQFLAFLKAEHEAERERTKADREDARERWETEQKRWEIEQKRLALEKESAARQSRAWLTLTESADRSGLPRTALKKAVQDGKLIASTAGGIRIQRASLDSFTG